MKEFEAKFTGYTYASARELLSPHGYTCIKPFTKMVRKTFHIEGNTQKWARVRDEGDKITMTIKEIVKDDDLSGVNEAEVIIDNFDEGLHFLNMCGFEEVAYQETHREIWQKDDIYVMIDEWPGITPFIEIEGPSPESVEKACINLGLNMDDALFGAADVVYTKEKGTPKDVINNLAVITFDNPPA